MVIRYDWLFWSVVAPFAPIILIIIGKVVQGDIGGLVDFLNAPEIPLCAFFVAIAAQTYMDKEMGFTSTVWDELEKMRRTLDASIYKHLQLYSSLRHFWLRGLV